MSTVLSDIDNARKLMLLLGDDEFVQALSSADELVREVDRTLDRVERIETEAGEAVREANAALNAVDRRLDRVDETLALFEAKVEAGFSLAFFVVALNRWFAGDPLLAAGLFGMGLLGASSLVVTIRRMPQVRRLRQVGDFATDRLGT